MQRIGSRAQVMHGNAKQTGGGLKKKDLKYNKQGKIVSKKMSTMAKKEKRLQKAGYITKKGQFGAVRTMRGGNLKLKQINVIVQIPRHPENNKTVLITGKITPIRHGPMLSNNFKKALVRRAIEITEILNIGSTKSKLLQSLTTTKIDTNTIESSEINNIVFLKTGRHATGMLLSHTLANCIRPSGTYCPDLVNDIGRRKYPLDISIIGDISEASADPVGINALNDRLKN
jgi:hypothetical protein